ncbi:MULTISPECIES: hypothetical protein [unclassified Nocardia]|uniref:hypothetical protein n=1 Tax=unclassified Nocardia TaxID=2637762 RepID=UPI00278C490D|nr:MULTISPECIES: hypothetical protein [unclassified Nocardia]
MLTIIGLIALLGAVAVGVAGVRENSGENNTLSNGFTVFGQNYDLSSGAVFGYGMLVGAVGACGLILLLTAVWTASRRGSAARRELRKSKREIAAARKESAAPPGETSNAPAARSAPDSTPTWSFNRFLHRPTTGKSASPASK